MLLLRLKPKDEPHREALEEALVDELYARSPSVLVGLCLVIPLVVKILGPLYDQPGVRATFYTLYAVIVARAITSYLARDKRGIWASTKVRHWVFAAGAVSVGACFCLINVQTYPLLDAQQHPTVAIAWIGISAIALVSMGSSPSVYLLYMMPNLLTLSIMPALGFGRGDSKIFPLLILLYICALGSMLLKEYGMRCDNILMRLELAEMALVDSLTGLRNRRFLTELLARETSVIPEPSHTERRASRTRDRLWILLIDLDHFKRINDTHGHAAGDAVLKQAAQRIRDVVRKDDVVARWGGEEFVVVARDGGKELAERIRTSMCEVPMTTPRGPITCSCSIGYSVYPLHATPTKETSKQAALTWEEILALADIALYRAKAIGRNQVVGVVAGKTWTDASGGLTTAAEVMSQIKDNFDQANQDGLIQAV